jgi:hypothetical protein
LAHARASEEVMKHSQETLARVHDRMQNDPAVIDLAEYFSKQMMLVAQLPMLEAAKQADVRGAVINSIMIWEDVNREFEEQLRPSTTLN